MSPTFDDGDFVIYLRKLLSSRPYQEKDVVVLAHPRYGTIVKRVCETIANDRYKFKSDHPQGVSSEQIGLCSKKLIKGKVIYHSKR